MLMGNVRRKAYSVYHQANYVSISYMYLNIIGFAQIGFAIIDTAGGLAK